MSRTATKSSAGAVKRNDATESKVTDATVVTERASTGGFKAGDRVSHPKFGNGVVKKIDADKLTIQFTRNVVKQILDYYVRRRH